MPATAHWNSVLMPLPATASAVVVTGMRVKSRTTRLPPALRERPVEATVPARVKLNVPPLGGAWMVTVDEPTPVTDGGLKLAVAPVGRMGASKVTTPLKPLF